MILQQPEIGTFQFESIFFCLILIKVSLASLAVFVVVAKLRWRISFPEICSNVIFRSRGCGPLPDGEVLSDQDGS